MLFGMILPKTPASIVIIGCYYVKQQKVVKSIIALPPYKRE